MFLRLRSAGSGSVQPNKTHVRLWPPIDALMAATWCPGRCTLNWSLCTYCGDQKIVRRLICCRSAAGRSPPQDTKRVSKPPGATLLGGNTWTPFVYLAAVQRLRAGSASFWSPLSDWSTPGHCHRQALGVASPSVVPRRPTYRRQQTSSCPTSHNAHGPSDFVYTSSFCSPVQLRNPAKGRGRAGEPWKREFDMRVSPYLTADFAL